MMSVKKQVPIDESILHLPSSSSEKPYLIGSRCLACGEVIFPKSDNCPNCLKGGMEQVALSSVGKVYSSTAVWYSPPLYKGQIPYVAGEVELPEGALVATIFTGCSQERPLEIDTEVELVTDKFGEDEEGNDIMIPKFKPTGL
jgi:uncharacterized OB-fold protein